MRLGQACRELALWVIYSMTPHIKRADCPFGLMRARELSSTFYTGEKEKRCHHPGKYNNKQTVHPMNTTLYGIIMTVPRMPECLPSWVGGLNQSQLTDRYIESEANFPAHHLRVFRQDQPCPVSSSSYHPQSKPHSPTPVQTSALLMPCPSGPDFTEHLEGFPSGNQVASFLLTHSHRNIFLISE